MKYFESINVQCHKAFDQCCGSKNIEFGFGSGPRKLLNMDPIRIRFHNTAFDLQFFKIKSCLAYAKSMIFFLFFAKIFGGASL